MEQLDKNVKYELLNYQVYRKRLNDLFKDERLLEMGLTYNSLGKTTYGYDIDCLKIGTGKKHIFLVGGTHGSEIISVDFVTQAASEIKNMSSFDPNLFTIFIVPLQNPEGFEVTTSSLKGIKENFSTSSKEYYLRYRMDNILSKLMHELNVFISENTNQLPSEFSSKMKIFFNEKLKTLKDARAIPEISLFLEAINNLDKNLNFPELQTALLALTSNIIHKLKEKEQCNINDIFFLEFANLIKQYFSKEEVWENIQNSNLKLHQKMFQEVGFNEIQNQNLQDGVKNIYNQYNHPQGSQVTYDATGIGINLNANTPFNPGIEERKNGVFSPRTGARENITNHVPGPLGSATEQVNDFSFAIENKVLYNLLQKSFLEGSYVSTFLYHGTGGMIYYLPPQKHISEQTYYDFLAQNTAVADVYKNATDYRLMGESQIMGYGDLLRGTFPNVLMIELSKMGGNPIAPYGDRENVLKCFQDNFKALDSVLSYYSLNLEETQTKTK